MDDVISLKTSLCKLETQSWKKCSSILQVYNIFAEGELIRIFKKYVYQQSKNANFLTFRKMAAVWNISSSKGNAGDGGFPTLSRARDRKFKCSQLSTHQSKMFTRFTQNRRPRPPSPTSQTAPGFQATLAGERRTTETWGLRWKAQNTPLSAIFKNFNS